MKDKPTSDVKSFKHHLEKWREGHVSFTRASQMEILFLNTQKSQCFEDVKNHKEGRGKMGFFSSDILIHTTKEKKKYPINMRRLPPQQTQNTS